MPYASKIVTAIFMLLCAPAVFAGFLGLSSSEDEILPADQAFIVQAPLWVDEELILGFDIAKGCYLYRDRITVDAISPEGFDLGFASLPLGESHHDEHFGDTTIYREQVSIRFRPKSGQPPHTVRVRYQGCAEDKVCYPSQTRVLEVITP